MLLSAFLILAQPNDLPKIALKAMECRPAALCVEGGPGEELEPHVAGAISKLGFEVLEPDAIEAMLTENGVSRAERDQLCHSEGCLTQLQDALGALGIEYLVVGRLSVRKGSAELFLTLRRQGDHSSLAKEFKAALTWQKLKPKIPALAKSTMTPLLPDTGTQDLGFDDDDDDAYEGPELRGGEVRRADGGLVLLGKPRRAQVVLKGPGGKRTTRIGAQLSRLQPGVYRWEAQAKGYEAKAGQVTVIVDEIGSLEVHLRKLATLRVKGGPKRAKVVVEGPRGDSKRIQFGQLLSDLPLGTYRVRVSKRGYEGEFQEVELRDGANETLTVRLKHYGSLHVTGKPKGAQVRIRGPDGVERKKGLPVVLSNAKRGRYWLKVSRPGYHSEEKRVEVRSGEKAKSQFDLRKVPLGGLSVDGSPKGAKVLLSLDDEPRQGELPVEWRNVPPGSYTLSVEHPGHQSEARRVRIRSGEINKVSVRLAKGVVGQSDEPRASQLGDYKLNLAFDYKILWLPLSVTGLSSTDTLDMHLAEQLPRLDGGWSRPVHLLGFGVDGNHTLLGNLGASDDGRWLASASYGYSAIRRPRWRQYYALEYGIDGFSVGEDETNLGRLTVSHNYLSLAVGVDVFPSDRTAKLGVQLGFRLSRQRSMTRSFSKGIETRVWGEAFVGSEPSAAECGSNCRQQTIPSPYIEGGTIVQWVGDWHLMAEEPWESDANINFSGVFLGLSFGLKRPHRPN